MAKKAFNPEEWLQDDATTTINTTHSTSVCRDTPADSVEASVEEIVRRIESSAADITANYNEWLSVGFALANAFGENGRSFFHRVSRFYSGYSFQETDKKFTSCLNSSRNDITVKTFFHIAKQHGIDVSIPVSKNKTQNHKKNSQNVQNSQNGHLDKMATEPLPSFPDDVFSDLPLLLQKVTCNFSSNEERDILLLGSLVTLSVCFPNISGLYGGVAVYPNLFLFVTAQASAGKGRLSLCRRLVEPVHRQLRDINKLEYSAYKRDQAEYVANKNNPDIEPPVEPPLRMLFIPANSSATAVFQILNANDGVGLMFETEGDTLAQTFKSEHGNYSDGLRKAFHHEKISYLRRKDHEYVTLETPKLSTVLSGTPRQIQTLIHDSENGLFSRFIFYYMNMRLQWMDVFATPNGCESLDRTFDRLGEEFFSFYKNITTLGPMTFQFSESQQTIFNGFFEELQVEYFDICGQDYIGTVRRLGLITYRIAMILTAVRLMDTGELSQAVTCSDTDFGISLSMARVLVQHAARVFQMLPTDNASLTNVCQAKNILLNALPSSFDRPTYLQTASRIGIPASTADKQIRRYIAQGLLGKEGTKVYVKKGIG